MNQKQGRIVLLAVGILVCLLAQATAGVARDQSGLKIVMRGDAQEIDPADFPPTMKEAYGTLQKFCTECHGQDRIIEALRSGKSREGKPYGEVSFHDKVTNIMRRPGVGMTREDARKLTELFTFLVKKAHAS